MSIRLLEDSINFKVTIYNRCVFLKSYLETVDEEPLRGYATAISLYSYFIFIYLFKRGEGYE